MILYSELRSISKRAIAEFMAAARAGRVKRHFGDQFITNEFEKGLRKRIIELENLDDCEIFNGATNSELVEPYLDVIRETLTEVTPDSLVDDFLPSVQKLAFLLFTRKQFSDSATGMVFAGFGSQEIFPTLIAFETDGIIGGRVKRQQTELVDIDRTGVVAHIEPFAQREMVDRFLDGIDPSYDQYLQSSIYEALTGFAGDLTQKFVRTTRKNKEKIIEYIRELADLYLEEFNAKADQRRTTNYRQKVLEMVHFMAKTDLAAMAESLVNLTSIKRRVSAELETVGGPIDVAVISKGEGFVWIKRKHYFDAELNPRYFVNQSTIISRWKVANES